MSNRTYVNISPMTHMLQLIHVNMPKGNKSLVDFAITKINFVLEITAAGVCYWPLKVKGTIKLHLQMEGVVFQNCVKVAVAKARKVIFCLQKNK